MANKNKHFSIKPKPYPFRLIFSFGENKKELAKSLKKYKLKCKTECEVKGVDGYFLPFENGVCLVRLYFYPKKIYQLAILQHELLHAVIYILRESGIKLSSKSEEAYTYLLEDITKKVLKHIKNGK